MRDFKFRAWHKKEKYMTEVVGMWHREVHPNGWVSTGQEFNIRTKHGIEDLADGGDGDWFEVCIAEELEIMQSTTLKDVNGIEIYEGDILKNVDVIDYGGKIEVGDIWEISFTVTDGCAGLRLYNNCLDNWPIDRTEIGSLVFNDDVGGEYFEVIGNIYENKGLIDA